MEAESTNTKNNISRSKAQLFKGLINLFNAIQSTTIAINQTNMRVENLIASFIDSAAKYIPQLLDSSNRNSNHITRIGSNEQLAIMSKNFIFTSRDNIIYHIPIIIGIRYHRETGIRINLSQHTLDKSNFITINSIISCHYRMFSRNSTNTNLVLCTVSKIVIVQIGKCGNGRSLIER